MVRVRQRGPAAPLGGVSGGGAATYGAALRCRYDRRKRIIVMLMGVKREM